MNDWRLWARGFVLTGACVVLAPSAWQALLATVLLSLALIFTADIATHDKDGNRRG